MIIELTNQNRLDEYYNAEQQTVEHFRFRQTFIRRTKKAFISFVANGLIKKVGYCSPVTHEMIYKRLQLLGLRRRFGDVREFYASYSTKHLRPPEIDFVQGRMSASVFMRNYFNPAWISDLKERVLMNAKELLELVATQ